MKLYTEEQVRFIAKAIYDRDFDPAKSPTELVKELIPIELPRDEEIKKLELEYAINFGTNMGIGFKIGCKWIKEQILNQNK